MTMESKLSFSLGNLSFSAEGDEGWLAEQMDKLIAAAPSFGQVAKQQPSPAQPAANGTGPSGMGDENFTDSLASYLKANGAETNQNKRFLTTADWLRRRGTQKLTTAAVAKALLDNQQKRLGNPADCLNQNVGKGLCEKTGDGFYLTPEGLKAMGHE